jgi:tRNA pseudouridine38-40 synthase
MISPPNSTEVLQKFRLTIAYDGTPFSGWQIQDNDTSIQGSIEDALFSITKERRRIVGSGRTDAGVHARGQVAHLSIEKRIEPHILKKALNATLPQEIRILEIEKVSPDFHAQISAIGKEYHYHLCLDEVVLPFDRPYVWHYRKKIDIPLLHEAAQIFLGEHDFRGFSNAIGGGLIKQNTIRTINRLDIVQTQIGLRLEFEGNGFLYKMVRNITGMLLSIASSKRPLGDIQSVFSSKDRSKAESGAPPQGLFLIQVFYPKTTQAS